MKILFWNVTGIGNKDWWKYIIEFDFISLSEIWMDEKGWKLWKERSSRSHEWVCEFAVKNKNKRRVKGGFYNWKEKRGDVGQM